METVTVEEEDYHARFRKLQLLESQKNGLIEVKRPQDPECPFDLHVMSQEMLAGYDALKRDFALLTEDRKQQLEVLQADLDSEKSVRRVLQTEVRELKDAVAVVVRS